MEENIKAAMLIAAASAPDVPPEWFRFEYPKHLAKGERPEPDDRIRDMAIEWARSNADLKVLLNYPTIKDNPENTKLATVFGLAQKEYEEANANLKHEQARYRFFEWRRLYAAQLLDAITEGGCK